MIVVIDPHSGVPAYRQIVEQVRFQVAGGILNPGTELPSTRTLSAELGINPMTVSKAYGVLEEAGLVQRRPGLPLVVRAASRERLAGERRERLRALLEPVAVAARQLGVEPEEATDLLREALAALEEEAADVGADSWTRRGGE